MLPGQSLMRTQVTSHDHYKVQSRSLGLSNGGLVEEAPLGTVARLNKPPSVSKAWSREIIRQLFILSSEEQ